MLIYCLKAFFSGVSLEYPNQIWDLYKGSLIILQKMMPRIGEHFLLSYFVFKRSIIGTVENSFTVMSLNLFPNVLKAGCNSEYTHLAELLKIIGFFPEVVK